MIQDQYSNTLTHKPSHALVALPPRRRRVPRPLLYVVAGVGLALLLTCLEGILWLAHPGHPFGGSTSYTLSTFFVLPLRIPALLFVPFLEGACGFGLAWALAQPLAILAYLKDVGQAQEGYLARYTPLQTGSYPYDVPLLYTRNSPGLALPQATRPLKVLELVETVILAPFSHLLLLGASGAGKTMFLHECLAAAAQHRRQIVFGKLKLPVFLPLRYYALFRQTFAQADSPDSTLLNALAASELPGLEHLRPYLGKLFRKGRLLFLCDGLDEVPEDARPTLDRELTTLAGQKRNGLVLTCTQQLFTQTPALVQTVSENEVPYAVLLPLKPEDRRLIIERFITELDARYRPTLPTAGQVMQLIESTRLRLICTTPLYLFALLELIEKFSIEELRDLDTRGRLLHAYLRKCQETHSRAATMQPEDLLFLREAACVAHWHGNGALLCLPAESAWALDSSEHRVNDEQAFQQALGDWLRTQQVRFPFATQSVVPLAEALPIERARTILQWTYQATLIDINAQGLLEFRHSLIASTLLAEYLASFLGAAVLHVEEIKTLPEDFVGWSEPFALWAGLLDYPLETAGALANWAIKHPEQRVNALLASLICLGVAQMPPGAKRQQSFSLPSEFDTVFELILRDPQALTSLANLFLCCAEQGAPELYEALFPLLMISGIETFLAHLGPMPVAERFFDRLVEIIDNVEQEHLVKLLVRALGGWEGAVVPRAAMLCAAHPSNGGRLRTAAINVLGGTRDQGAVEPLLSCLSDPDAFIARRAANALVRLGPELTLQRLLYETERYIFASSPQPLPAMLLPIIERFLNESMRQLSPAQFERSIDALLSLLTRSTIPADREKAREMLVSQGRLATERDSGKHAIRRLVQNLATPDETVANTMSGTLKEVGAVATPSLLAQLEEQPSETERVRILGVLAAVQDERALPALLRLLADNSPLVQQALASALASYAPTCFPGLIDALLNSPSELVATRAEQILSFLGPRVVGPVVEALTPVVVGRTPLLVHVLERARDPQTLPALIALLGDAQSDATLTLALIQALGEFSDQRVVRPLLDLLTHPNPLVYEGAINALSKLGDLACADLLPQLTGTEKTPRITRVERVLLGMQPFPGERLLQALDGEDQEQMLYIEEVFLARGNDAAQLLAVNLFHRETRTRVRVRQTMSRMDGRHAVPALLEVLQKPDPAWRELVASLLLEHPREAIPPLVGLLDDPERGEAVVAILLQAGKPVLPALVPALDSARGVVQTRARAIMVTLVQNQHELLTDVVQLFSLTLPPEARTTLMDVLTKDLVEFSLPALLAGLEDAHLVADVAATLVRLAQGGSAQSASVLEQLLLALRSEARRYGASLTLIELGAQAVPGVGALITDPDAQVSRSARQILGEIGTVAFPFLWAAHSDASNPARREAARDIFRAMPTTVIKDELVALLTSARQEEISMALALLLERIHDEAREPVRGGEMVSALLEHVQSSSNERASLRILALLILLGGPAVGQALIAALQTNSQGHAHLVQSLLLLDQEVEAELLAILRDNDAPTRLQAEVAGILAMRVPNQDVAELALGLSEHGLWAGRSAHNVTTVLQPSQLEISLHALGGLLVAGHWDALEIQDRRAASKVGSAERELYDTLLGWRYTPQLTRLEHELELERTERKQELLTHTQELLAMKAQMIDLEQDLDQLKREHEEQHRGHEEKRTELQEAIARLTQEKQALQTNLRQMAQERQVLVTSAQQASQEQARLQAEAERWQVYSQQLEKELTALRRPKSNA